MLISLPAQAKCYTQAEAEAEQGLRIHSELMVIALNCQHLIPKSQPNLYMTYRIFTQKYAGLFGSYENTLISHFRQEGGDAEAQLHDMRTRFANDMSAQVAHERPDRFCARYAQRVPKASTFSMEEIKEWASTPYPGHATSRPLCASSH